MAAAGVTATWPTAFTPTDKSSPWLQQRVRAAWDAFAALPMPSSQQDEDWRRTDISGLQWEAFNPVAEGAADVAGLMQRQAVGAPGAGLVIDDGHELGLYELDRVRNQGIVVESVASASLHHAREVQAVLSQVAVDESKFLALWSALCGRGTFIYVPKGVAAAVPIWVTHAAGRGGSLIAPTTLLYLDEGSSLTLVDDYYSDGSQSGSLSVGATVASLQDGAHLNHCSLQQWDAHTWHFATHRILLGREAQLRTFFATFGGRLQKIFWEAQLQAEAAQAHCHGLAFADGKQHLDHQSLQSHRAPQTTSSLLLRAAVKDEAKSVYSGLINVEPEAKGADGYVQNRNLILSPGAKADSIPRLEIKANDVRCGHGATAGQIDEEQRFYLTSRGIPASETDRIIVRGFMGDVLEQAPSPEIAQFVEHLLEEKLATAFGDNRG